MSGEGNPPDGAADTPKGPSNKAILFLTKYRKVFGATSDDYRNAFDGCRRELTDAELDEHDLHPKPPAVLVASITFARSKPCFSQPGRPPSSQTRDVIAACDRLRLVPCSHIIADIALSALPGMFDGCMAVCWSQHSRLKSYVVDRCIDLCNAQLLCRNACGFPQFCRRQRT